MRYCESRAAISTLRTAHKNHSSLPYFYPYPTHSRIDFNEIVYIFGSFLKYVEKFQFWFISDSYNGHYMKTHYVCTRISNVDHKTFTPLRLYANLQRKSQNIYRRERYFEWKLYGKLTYFLHSENFPSRDLITWNPFDWFWSNVILEVLAVMYQKISNWIELKWQFQKM